MVKFQMYNYFDKCIFVCNASEKEEGKPLLLFIYSRNATMHKCFLCSEGLCLESGCAVALMNTAVESVLPMRSILFF